MHGGRGASNSAQLQRELEEQREQERRTRKWLEAMEQQMQHFTATYRPEMYIRHPETTPQVLHMGNMGYHSNTGLSMPAMGSFGSFPYENFNQFQTPDGNRGGIRGSSRGGSRHPTRRARRARRRLSH
ncbi:unnamed protein product [Cuscuta epithymum]|uniref:Uncharacterized protein n=1 Tax=Cuscuta epithymum TaxID=186058 RepID=A0AAV0DN64_9ASTE|nr:unnamed protein product [Cuscuta epithymum]